MGSGGYTGGHTKVFLSKSGTSWEVSDPFATQPGSPTLKRWDKKGVEAGGKIDKQSRSFLSMCAVSFYNDALTDNSPKPPPAMQKELRTAGGNRRWIASDSVRLKVFEDFYLKRARSVTSSP
jgi:hypothetical protein